MDVFELLGQGVLGSSEVVSKATASVLIGHVGLGDDAKVLPLLEVHGLGGGYGYA